MKKLISLFLVLMLLLGILAAPALAEVKTCGILSFLNLSEEDETRIIMLRYPVLKRLFVHGVWEGDYAWVTNNDAILRFYDSMNDMLMGLQAGIIDSMEVPYYTAKYLCSTNDGLKMVREYHADKIDENTQGVIDVISDSYSFMLKKENTALRDAFDEQIAAMKADGTLKKLIDEHILRVAEGGEPVAVAFEKFEGDPIKIAVTGSLPPMDYVAPDGSFAGFNTAVLAEIGKRMQKNIELVQVDSIGRSMALAEGTVDVVFWTRGLAEAIAEELPANLELSEEDLKALKAKFEQNMTEEEKAAYSDKMLLDTAIIAKNIARDMPENTIITQPYFSDYPIWVILK